jgi:HTH-type transcriptional regulator/antitoxin HigA
MTFSIKPIHSAADHAAALAKIESLWEAKPGTRDGDTLEVLATLVEAYEREHTPILPPDPVEAIKFRLEQQGKSRRDLEPILGTRARVSEILGGKRPLSLAMIRGLHRTLGIPLEVLVAERVSARGRKVGAGRARSPNRAVTATR